MSENRGDYRLPHRELERDSREQLLSLFEEDHSTDLKTWHILQLLDNREVRSSKELEVVQDIIESFLIEWFRKKEIVYPSDVAAGLDLDYDLVIKIFGKFIREDKLRQ